MRTVGGWAASPLVKYFAVTLSAAGVGACTSGPLETTSSLSPAIQGDTLGYANALGDVSDQILLTNILRARDYAPLAMSELSSVSGALSLQGTVGLTFPFGPLNGSTTRASAAPSVTASTTPTFSLSPLNTEGFTLNAAQPISAAYVQNRWDAGISRELLLLLFVKEIDFPDQEAPAEGTVIHSVKYVNDPDVPEQFDAYTHLVRLLLHARAELRTFDVLDPVGPEFDLYGPANPSVGDSTLKAQPNQTSYGLITQSNDGQYHVGNFRDGSTKQARLYRVYAGQVAICVDTDLMPKNYTIPGVNPPNPSTAQKQSPKKEQKIGQTSGVELKETDLSIAEINGISMAASAMHPGGGGGGQQMPPAMPPGGPSGGPHGTGPAAGPTPGTASQATTAALQAGRVSSIVDSKGCGAGEIVLRLSSEKAFETKSKGFVHVEWRSISEVFEYLGAILRYNKRNNIPMHWHEAPDGWIATNDSSPTDVSAYCAREPDLTNAKTDAERAAIVQADQKDKAEHHCGLIQNHTLFDVSADGNGYLNVSYRGSYYSVHDGQDGATDHTVTVLSMLGTLVNLAKVSSDISISQPIRFLPLP